MSEKSKISVIIPCYNYAHFLEDAVGSVINQTYYNWECLIIDDGSTDNTKEVSSKLVEQDSRIRYVYQENMGLAATRNRGFALSQGEYIQFLDADDMIHPHKLQEQIQILDGDPAIGVSYTNYQVFTDNPSNLSGRYSHLTLGVNPLEDFLFKWERGLSIPIHAALFRRSIFEKQGKPFVEDLRAKEDWVMWVSLSADGVLFKFLDKDYCYYRSHSLSQTNDYKSMYRFFMKASFTILNILPSSYHEKFIDSSLCHAEAMYLNIISKATLYYEIGVDFNSIDSITQAIRVQEKFTFKLSYDLSLIDSINQLRFDPLEGYWIRAKLKEVCYRTKSGEMKKLDLSTVTSNGSLLDNGYILFQTFDPMIFLPIAGDIHKLEISGEIHILGNQEIEKLLTEKAQLIEKLNHQSSIQAQEIERKNLEIEGILNSNSWRITAPLRKIFSWL